MSPEFRSYRKHARVLLGPLAFVVLLAADPAILTPDQTAIAAGTAWIVLWWVTEAVPIPVTSLLPIVLFPVTGVMAVGEATTPYADPIIFLLLGGFLIALAIERWNLHHRLSLLIIQQVGADARTLVLGFMGATAVLSMWISNTATAMMMVPIAAAVLLELTVIGGRRRPPLDADDLEEPEEPGTIDDELIRSVSEDPSMLPNTDFGLALMLGIAYGASIGGAATLIGSPPNAILAGIAESELGIEIGFLEWFVGGLPVSVVFLFIAWGLLMFTLRPRLDSKPGRDDVVDRQLEALGSMTVGERRVLAVFGLVAAGWITRPFLIEPVLPVVTDAMIAIIGAILVFLVPVGDERLLDWEYTTRVPWGVLLLLGAGFSIARGFQLTDLDEVLADQIAGLGITELGVMLFLVAAAVMALTNVTSNTATAALFMPIAISIATALDVAAIPLMATAAFAASFAFVLPVATAPNAIVFGTGYMTIPEMAKIGLVLTVPAIIFITLTALWWFPLVWG